MKISKKPLPHDFQRQTLGQTLAASLGEQKADRLLALQAEVPGPPNEIPDKHVNKKVLFNYTTELETRRDLFVDLRELARQHGCLLNAP